MAQQQRKQQFNQIIRSFMSRYIHLHKQKSPQKTSQLQQYYINNIVQSTTYQQTISNIVNLEYKTTQLKLILLMSCIQLWYKNYNQNPQILIDNIIILFKSSQRTTSIIYKQYQLVNILLNIPSVTFNLNAYSFLYHFLKQTKQYQNIHMKQMQKQIFLKTVQQSIQMCCTIHSTNTLTFIVDNILDQLSQFPNQYQFVPSRLKLLKVVAKYSNDISLLNKISFVVIKFSKEIHNLPLFNHLLTLYQFLIAKLIQNDNSIPLLLYRHIIFDNLANMLSKTCDSYYNIQIILYEAERIFHKKYIYYFMKNYDLNFMELSVCQQTLELFYSYTENAANDKKIQSQLIKKHIKHINKEIREYLQEIEQKYNLKQDQRIKIYQLKKKEYKLLLDGINNTPKKIFKMIEKQSNENKIILMKKIAKIIIQSAHIQSKAMINIMGQQNNISKQIFTIYAQQLLKFNNQLNLQQYLRTFTINFFLSGESQQIGRILDKITQIYYQNQPKQDQTIKSSDATYAFANAIIILNTDLHNPKVQMKITQQQFIKMCSKINNNQDLPTPILTSTYNNIKKEKINTFRSRDNISQISMDNWRILNNLIGKQLEYYDMQLEFNHQFYINYLHHILSNIVDEKQIIKLENLIQSFTYQQQIYHCQIVQQIRSSKNKKPYIVLHSLQTIFKFANFKYSKIHQQTYSYLWLTSTIIQQFHQYIPINIICQFLIHTCKIRIQLNDNLYIHQKSQIKRIKKCIKNTQKLSKKSIMDLFSNFLSSTDIDSDIQPSQCKYSSKSTFRNLTLNVFELLYSQLSAIKCIIQYLKNDQIKLFQQFISCLYMVFKLLYNISIHNYHHFHTFIQQLLGIQNTQFYIRIHSLKNKDQKKYYILYVFTHFWVLKLLLNWTRKAPDVSPSQDFLKLLHKASEFFDKCDTNLMDDLITQIEAQHSGKMFTQPFLTSLFKAVQKIYPDKKDLQWLYDRYSLKKSDNQILNINEKINQKEENAHNSNSKQAEASLNAEKVQIKSQQNLIDDSHNNQQKKEEPIKDQNGTVQKNDQANASNQEKKQLHQDIAAKIEIKQQKNFILKDNGQQKQEQFIKQSNQLKQQQHKQIQVRKNQQNYQQSKQSQVIQKKCPLEKTEQVNSQNNTKIIRKVPPPPPPKKKQGFNKPEARNPYHQSQPIQAPKPPRRPEQKDSNPLKQSQSKKKEEQSLQECQNEQIEVFPILMI